MEHVRVACCQMSPTVGDRSGNLRLIRERVTSAVAAGAQIVVLPELAGTGYSFADHAEALSHAEDAAGETVAAWAAQAAELGIVIVGGFLEAGSDGRLYNSAALVGAGEPVIYRKTHLWDTEKRFMSGGSGLPPVVDTPFGRLGVMICYDLEFPEWVRSVAIRGAELLCAPVNWPLVSRPARERPAELVRVQANASVNRLPIAVADRARADRGQSWLGGSAIVGADGYPSALARLGADDTIVAEVNLGQARDKRISANNHVLDDREPGLSALGGLDGR